MSTFRSVSILLFSFAALAAIYASPSKQTAHFHAGQRTFSFHSPRHLAMQLGVASTTINGIIWYPVNTDLRETGEFIGGPSQPLFYAANVATNAPIAASSMRFPLIVVSHGTGGTAKQMAWLGAVLARDGFIVVAIDHPGNNNDEKTVQGFTMWWLRPETLSLALDEVLANPEFGPRIDRSRIGAAGFSIGGFSALALAGAVVDVAQYRASCSAKPVTCDTPRELPDFAKRKKSLMASNPGIRAALTSGTHSEPDGRIRAVFAIAPAIGVAVTAESLHAIRTPVRIVYGGKDRSVLPEYNARLYAAAIPKSTLFVVHGAAHYTFLDVCTDFGKAMLPIPCGDPKDVSRHEVHAAVAADAAAFFSHAL